MGARRLTVTLAILALAGGRARADEPPPAPPADRAADCDAATAASLDGDLTRAALLVEACPAGSPVRLAVARTLTLEHYSRVAIVTRPDGAAVALDGHDELPLRGGDAVWLAPGAYTFRAGAVATTIHVAGGEPAVAELDLPMPDAPAPSDVIEHHEVVLSIAPGPVPRPDPTSRPGGLGARVSAGPGELDGGVRRLGWTLGLTARSLEIGRAYLQADLGWAHRASAGHVLDTIQLPTIFGTNLHQFGPRTLSAYIGLALDYRLHEVPDPHAALAVDAGFVGGFQFADGGRRWFTFDLRYERLSNSESVSLGVSVMLF